jgi:hypothetical protein
METLILQSISATQTYNELAFERVDPGTRYLSYTQMTGEICLICNSANVVY